jgi:hypothetical protein
MKRKMPVRIWLGAPAIIHPSYGCNCPHSSKAERADDRLTGNLNGENRQQGNRPTRAIGIADSGTFGSLISCAHRPPEQGSFGGLLLASFPSLRLLGAPGGGLR